MSTAARAAVVRGSTHSTPEKCYGETPFLHDTHKGRQSVAGHFYEMAVSTIPFVVTESVALTEGVISLFDRSFHASPPDFPRHFVALEAAQPSEVAAYVHFTAVEAGVFLLGGLCVDERCYRRMDHQQRRAIAAEGSLSRWLMRRSIDLLKPARAIFGYTGDVRSRRDIAALGFVVAVEPYLFVQWHDEPVHDRDGLIRRIDRLGPF